MVRGIVESIVRGIVESIVRGIVESISNRTESRIAQ